MELEIVGQENNGIASYLDNLQTNSACTSCRDSFLNTGKPVHEVGKRQKNRKVKERSVSKQKKHSGFLSILASHWALFKSKM